MNEFIEKNKRLLNIYCVVARIIGWLLLVFAAVIAVAAVIKLLSGSLVDEQRRTYSYMLYLYCRQSVFIAMLGLVLLGLAQFVEYLYHNNYQPGWVLRNAGKILYLYAAVIIVSPVLQSYLNTVLVRNGGPASFLLYLLPTALPALAKGLVFVGIAQVLPRVQPIIEESKTLV
jgi:hypothetical protein